MNGVLLQPEQAVNAGVVVSIAQARKLASLEGLKIIWRPDGELAEAEQYAVVFEVGV